MKTLLFKPFQKYQATPLLITGLLALCLSIYFASILNIRFDGALDLHIVKSSDIMIVLKDIAIAIPCILICLFVIGKIINSKTRIIDIFTTILIARIPLYLIIFFNTNNYINNATQQLVLSQQANSIKSIEPTDIITLSIIGLVSLGCIIWLFVLLWNGFKIATNAKGNKPVWLFIVAVIIAEIISKILLATIV